MNSTDHTSDSTSGHEGSEGPDPSGNSTGLPPSTAQAKAELHSDAFVRNLEAEALAHRAVRHPYLDALAQGSLPDDGFALREFARHYNGYSKHFPLYLRAALEQLVDDRHRSMLSENLLEESGEYSACDLEALEALGMRREWFEGVPHPQLFQRFAGALGITDPQLETEDRVSQWSDAFLSLLETSSSAAAIGAIGLGTENIVSTVYQPFLLACERMPELSPSDSIFFALHTTVDEAHQAVLRQITEELATTPQARTDIRAGMLEALALRESFWDWLYARALNPADH
jgi:pyrroloquinoline quinone (PQQ) biosynthesis protein C